MNSFTITNAVIVTPNGVIENASLQIEEGIISSIDRTSTSSAKNTIDAGGGIVMPGIIDIHTDALDAEIIPRPGADIPVRVAFRELERKMSGCGLTTVFHSLHLGYHAAETTSKSKYSRGEVFHSVYQSSIGKTLLNNKIHLRFEISGVEAYNECFELIDKGYISLLSVMDHTPGQGQYPKANFIAQTIKQGKTELQAKELFEQLTSRPIVGIEKLYALISHAKKAGIPVASHDDDTVEKVDHMYNMGVNICEFPVTFETAEHATNLGMHVVGGASNILRGGSLSGNLNMADAVKKKVVNSLCSDYYPPAILHSVFQLYHEGETSMPDAVNLATLNPAKAAGIAQYTGSIEVGKHADLLIVKLIDAIPMVTHTLVRGSVVSQASFKTTKEKYQTAF